MSNKTVEEIKISDELLSWVFDLNIDCCDVIENEIIYYQNKGYDGETVKTINLHTFIHLAKIKAFECGYVIEELVFLVQVVVNGGNPTRKIVKTVTNCDNDSKPFDVRVVLKNLEWVAEKVGGNCGNKR